MDGTFLSAQPHSRRKNVFKVNKTDFQSLCEKIYITAYLGEMPHLKKLFWKRIPMWDGYDRVGSQ